MYKKTIIYDKFINFYKIILEVIQIMIYDRMT